LKDFVSSHWISLVTLVASTSVICAAFVRYGFPWTGLAWASLALAAAQLLVLRSPRWIKQVIGDVENEPRPAVPVPQRVAMPIGAAQLRLRREGTL